MSLLSRLDRERPCRTPERRSCRRSSDEQTQARSGYRTEGGGEVLVKPKPVSHLRVFHRWLVSPECESPEAPASTRTDAEVIEDVKAGKKQSGLTRDVSDMQRSRVNFDQRDSFLR